MGFYMVIIASLIMYLVEVFFLGMLKDLYDSRRRYLVNVMQLAIFSGVFISRDELNFINILLLLGFVYIAHVISIIVEYLIAFREFSKMESE